MRGHIGHRIPRRIYELLLTQLTVDVLTHAPEAPEINLTQLTVAVLTHAPEAPEINLTQLTVDVLTY
jgi:hypothetical protein